MTVLDSRTEKNLLEVHPDLVRVVRRAASLSALEFVVTEGRRTLKRQQELLKAGATRTLNSRHLTGHAVDVAVRVAGQVRWDWPLYSQIAVTMKTAARELGVPITWGGDWKSFRDGPHFELPRSTYP